MDAQEYCNPYVDPDCNPWLNGGLLPPPSPYPIGPPERFCRSKNNPSLFTFWPGNQDCPEGFAPTTFGTPPICPVPTCPDSGCQLGVIRGSCAEFWILLALVGFVVWKGKKL